MDIWQRVSDIFGMLNSIHVKVGSQFEIYLSISSVKSHQIDSMMVNPARYILQFFQLTKNIFDRYIYRKKTQND